MKRETKAQRTEREIAALEQRLTDIFTGACGCLPDSDLDLVACLGADGFSNFLSGLGDAFCIDPYKDYCQKTNENPMLLRHWNFGRMKNLRELAEFWYERGIRA